MSQTWSLINNNGIRCIIIYGNCADEIQAYFHQISLIITSPPYADARARHYESIGPDNYLPWFSQFHQPFWSALTTQGSFILNIKDKVVKGVRHRYVWELIKALSKTGFFCIDDYIWHKKNSVPGRWTARLRDGWEYIFHLAKDKKPYFNQDAVKIPPAISTIKKLAHLPSDRPKQWSQTGSGFISHFTPIKEGQLVLPANVLHISTESQNRGHPAAFPSALPTFFIKLLSKPHSIICDPFAGSGTTGVAAIKLNRHCILIDNKYEYCETAKNRLMKECNMKEDFTVDTLTTLKTG